MKSAEQKAIERIQNPISEDEWELCEPTGESIAEIRERLARLAQRIDHATMASNV